MNQKKNSIFQKIKDKTFYVALSVGMLAVLGVVTVYTNKQSDLDANGLNDTSALDVAETTQSHPNVKETAGKITKEDEIITTQEYVNTKATTENTQLESTILTAKEERDYALPVTSNAGELDFNSESTISWPLEGKTILPYSMDTTVYFKTLDQYECNPGVLIASKDKDTVKNVYMGQVTKVTSDEKYGNMITVYLGNDYSAVYGQIDEIYVKEGDYLKAGDVIGTVANPTRSFSEEGKHLFFQMKKGEQPVDPALFVSEETKES